MKNATKMTGIITVTFIALAIISCKEDEPTPTPTPILPTVPSVLHGTWETSPPSAKTTYVFTANSYTYTLNSISFTINVHSYSTAANTESSTKDDYPSGYNLVGKVAFASDGFESNPIFSIGGDFSEFFFLNKENQNKMAEVFNGTNQGIKVYLRKSNAMVTGHAGCQDTVAGIA